MALQLQLPQGFISCYPSSDATNQASSNWIILLKYFYEPVDGLVPDREICIKTN